MRVASITVYPVKSMRGTSVDQADVELAGLRHDRRWMVIVPKARTSRRALTR